MQARRRSPLNRKAPRLLLWIFLWGIFLAAALCALAQRYFSAHLQEIIARHSPESPVEIIPGEAIGGQKSAEITARLLKEVDDLKPDNCLFVGHQLAKKEIVEYLSALSQIATVKLVLGPDDTGKSQLADPRSPLREYQFTEVREASMPIRSQVLFAFNNGAQQGAGLHRHLSLRPAGFRSGRTRAGRPSRVRPVQPALQRLRAAVDKFDAQGLWPVTPRATTCTS